MLEQKSHGSTGARLMVGGGLIAFGLVLFFTQDLDWLRGPLPLVVLGAIFVVAYFVSKNDGLLIPGCLLLGLASRDLFASMGVAYGPVFGLGVGFFAIYLIPLIYERSAHWWPLIPGTALVLTGLARMDDAVRFMLSRGWPLLLVGVGILLLLGEFGRARRKSRRD